MAEDESRSEATECSPQPDESSSVENNNQEHNDGLSGARESTISASASAVRDLGNDDNYVGTQSRQQPLQAGRGRMPPQLALQAYLIRQQYIAGIPPDQMVSMTGRRAGELEPREGRPAGQARVPSILQFSNDGIFVPRIPPARFNGPLRPLPDSLLGLGGVTRSSDGNSATNIGTTQPPGNILTSTQTEETSDSVRGLVLNPSPKLECTDDSESNGHKDGDGIQSTSPDYAMLSSLVKCPDLFPKIAKWLELEDIKNLYTISRGLNAFMNEHMAQIVEDQAAKRNPLTSQIFPWQCYSKVRMPIAPESEQSMEKDALENIDQVVPTFKWLSMLSHREMVLKDIMGLMTASGNALPPCCEMVLFKIWFLMDIPDNARRQWTVRNKNLWTDDDIFFAALIFVRLELRFEASLAGLQTDGMRRLLMAQPGLTLLWNSLRTTSLQSHFETLRAFVRWRYMPTPSEAGMPIFGVPLEEIGTLQYEGYGKSESKVRLQRPDQIILKESRRRQIDMRRLYTEIEVRLPNILRPDSTIPHEPVPSSALWIQGILQASERTEFTELEKITLDE
ncbi:hypothetical protein ASPZODRAFT_1360151 [Penicilliopsis zonata CBS 506.65]|uniref:Uncharacterized protein n=1 Tax=Penicilliopsis zonata CBS 506.65 TaxID=1073090 RepID=A0A1L9SNY5_9EURO|nr:hypothetical protein ASPZODRAFT_1360151 [Penicilliopsis zonata CBS 506.65]OJJ48945.1 hypothetical protein ASPZODRAFT_1360151 [Penicilliopsis zonata CBS 506.65]